MTEQEPTPQQEEREAIERMARTDDGRLLHRYLRRVLEAVIDLESDSALRLQTGRRTLARDLMRLMAEGIDERRSDPADQPILARSGGPVHVVNTRRDRRDRYPRVDSFGPDRDADGNPNSGDGAA